MVMGGVARARAASVGAWPSLLRAWIFVRAWSVECGRGLLCVDLIHCIWAWSVLCGRGLFHVGVVSCVLSLSSIAAWLFSVCAG